MGFKIKKRLRKVVTMIGTLNQTLINMKRVLNNLTNTCRKIFIKDYKALIH